MRKLWILIFIPFIFSGELSSQTHDAILRTSVVNQTWSIAKLNDAVAESTLPIEIIYPVRENLNIQISHTPAVSRFATYRMSGLSDIWIRSGYAFSDNRALFSFGVGLPTGKTQLDASEQILGMLLSQNAFKFRAPVLGQGLTISAGIMYAYPIMEKMTFGAGVNYVFRGTYKYSKLINDKYDPGDQIGANFGFDYLITPKLRTNVDLILSYYMADKLNNTKMFVSGMKTSAKLGLQYQAPFGFLWMRVFYRTKAKNEAWDGQAVVPDDKNYNITLREVEGGIKIGLTQILSLSVMGEIRSYVENENKKGQVDLFGGGVGYDLQVTERFGIGMTLKLFFGNGEFMNTISDFSGLELILGTQWKF